MFIPLRPSLAILVFCSLPCLLAAQDKAPAVFGKISAADFAVSSPIIDSGTGAVVLADIGSTRLEGYDEGFHMIFTVFRRIKIINRNGYDAAKFSISFSVEENNKGKLKTVDAITYNLVNGQVEETPLRDVDCFIDTHDDEITKERFALPDVKEGSVIDVRFTLKSTNIARLVPWDFQDQYPVLWSEYKVTIPALFNYVFLEQGYQPIFKKTVDSVMETIRHGIATEDAMVYSTRWIMKDIPALKEEPFTSTLDNHIARVQFQQSMYPSGLARIPRLQTWEAFTNKWLYSPSFGDPVMINNHWLRSDLDKITGSSTTESEKAKKIFAFVRDNFAVTGRGVRMRSEYPLKEVFRTRSGTVAEINLLLIAMLRQDDIKAVPLILSTRDNGLTNITYPFDENFNYVIGMAVINNKTYYLDATDRKLGFGRLPVYCYNGQARVIAPDGGAVFLAPDSLHEVKNTSVFISNEANNSLSGYYTSNLGYYESLELRKRLAGTQLTDFYKSIAAGHPGETAIDSVGIDSLTRYDDPVCLHYNFRFTPGDNDLFYFTPIVNPIQNPFKSAQRLYPVEMPYTKDETFVLTMDIPTGYKVDEIPKSVKVKLNDTEGMFEYSIGVIDNSIQLRTRVVLKKAIYQPADYESLRDFFSYVVKKQAEPVVFRKIK